jgi:hypothetical protein
MSLKNCSVIKFSTEGQRGLFNLTETHCEASLDNPTSTLVFMEYPLAEASTHKAKQG